MKLLFSGRAFSTVFIVPVVVVVMVLAVLLYRWSNQVSEATTVRLADSLQMSMVNWHLNLFRDLSDICLALRVDSAGGETHEQYVRRFAAWKKTAPYPDVVENLYVLMPHSATPSALHLNPESGRFDPAVWPPRLAALRGELRESVSALVRERPQPGPAKDFSDAFALPGGGLAEWAFEPKTPALVRPIGGGSEWLVVELNKSVIQTKLLPGLAQRYFMGVDGLDYLVAVVEGDGPRAVVYSSDPGFGAQKVDDADGRMDVFGRITARDYGAPIYVFHKLSEDAGLKGLAASIGTSWFPLIGEVSDDDAWQLIVRHRRGGALGAFVAEMHRRDLAISFGVLLLLVVSVGLVIVASQRAHRLANLQMGFVTAVSHELRTPLTIISSAAENITHGVVGGKEQLAQYGTVIEAQSRKLSRLVEGILLFAATRENRQRYAPRLLEVSEIVKVAVAATSDLIAAGNFELDVDVAPELPGVMGDLSALSQCLQNLIVNALKYGGTARWIGLRAEMRKTDEGECRVEISVSDRGMGIERADLPHIFEPFYRSASAMAAQIHGTGLGLPLAKTIAEAMHGTLTVVSEVGKGSTFTVELPCAAEETQRA